MDKKQVAVEIKEDLRTNTALRHRLGLAEGEGDLEILEDGETIAWHDGEGNNWFLQVQEG